MASPIERYALLGDCETAALVSLEGSVDWLCLPRFDSGACFAALLGKPDHGRWLIAPSGPVRRTTRAYRDGTLVLDTTFETDEGAVTLTDAMPLRDSAPRLVRVVRGVRGRVRMKAEIVIRFDYGSIVPWVQKMEGGIHAVAGPDAVCVTSDVPLVGENMTTTADFEVSEGQEVSFALAWHPSYAPPPAAADVRALLAQTERAWGDWTAQCTYEGRWRDRVLRSLVTLKALTHSKTGGIVAAPTTSLPEALGGVRNWDYRFCWVRDATFTLLSLLQNGFLGEARAWREWLLRAVAGDPSKLQIMYAVDGERRLGEHELPWLPGYEGSRPVRVGNAAYEQRQLDVYGEVTDVLFQGAQHGLEAEANAWNLQRKLLEFLETQWTQPDDGIWEVRGPQRHFTHSKMMAWVAFDRGARLLEAASGDGLLARWQALRDRIHDDVCQHGYDANERTFVQYYGSKGLDASLLMMPLVGFLPPSDERVRGTVAAIERRLMHDGLVRRYESAREVDGLPEGEGVFLPCSFWLADCWALLGRQGDAEALFERLSGLCNDVGLLSEEYDIASRRLVGNFPQAFSHVSLVNSARTLSDPKKGAAWRRAR